MLEYLHQGEVVSGTALYYAAMIMQNGRCLADWKLASTLSERSMRLGEFRAQVALRSIS